MSDRHSAGKRFNGLILDFRAKILPTITENWDQLSDSQLEQLTRINNLFCGLHFVVGLANAAEEAVKLWKSNLLPDENFTSSGTQRLVQTACKAFHHKRSQQSGSSALFRTYL